MEESSSGQVILSTLRQSSGRALQSYLSGALERQSHDDPLSGSDIDLIIEELQRIEKEDSYEAPVPSKSKNPPMYHPNRAEAKRAIGYFKCRKVANDLRKLPREERVSAIMDAMEGRRSDGVDGASGWFRSELALCGKEAVSLIVKHAPTTGNYPEVYIAVLGSIGSPDAADYLTRVFQDSTNTTWIRCNAIIVAASNPSPGTVSSLIEQLRDETAEGRNRCEHQTSRSDNEPCAVQIHPVQSCAAQALNQTTGRHWGAVFNEDYRTWAAWRDSTNREQFHPFMLARGETELKDLAFKMLYREMARCWSGATSEWGKSEAQLIAENLKILDPYGLAAVVEDFYRRAPDLKNPTALEKLKDWTAGVLSEMDTPEADKAAESLFEFQLSVAP
jgi:hypothetical protein